MAGRKEGMDMAARKKILQERSYKVVYREGDTVVKRYLKGHPKEYVFNEAHIQSVVEATGLPVPKVISVTPDGEDWLLTMEYVKGRTMKELFEENKKKPKAIAKLMDKFIDIQLDVNSRKAEGLRNTRTKMDEAIAGLSDIDASTRYELRQRIHGMERHTKLCHGDLTPGNVILNDDGSYFILDWAHASKGNAGADAAITYMMTSLYYPDFAKKYLKAYCARADMPIQYIQKWIPIVAAHQLSKHIPGEEELLTKWISVAEYQ